MTRWREVRFSLPRFSQQRDDWQTYITWPTDCVMSNTGMWLAEVNSAPICTIFCLSCIFVFVSNSSFLKDHSCRRNEDSRITSELAKIDTEHHVSTTSGHVILQAPPVWDQSPERFGQVLICFPWYDSKAFRVSKSVIFHISPRSRLIATCWAYEKLWRTKIVFNP